MTQFNVGDKVRRLAKASSEDVQPGTEWVVAGLPRDGWICLEGTAGMYLTSGFELIEPAEIEQATAILDKTNGDGWWNVAPEALNESVRDTVKFYGLEVRVQVRRKVAGA